MSLLSKIKADALVARKAKDSVASSLLITLGAESARVGLDSGKRESSDAEVVAIVKKFIKGNTELLSVRPDDAVALRERDLLSVYLPQQMNEKELEGAVSLIKQELSLDATDKSFVGVMMKELRARYEGRYDGAVASSILKRMAG